MSLENIKGMSCPALLLFQSRVAVLQGEATSVLDPGSHVMTRCLLSIIRVLAVWTHCSSKPEPYSTGLISMFLSILFLTILPAGRSTSRPPGQIHKTSWSEWLAQCRSRSPYSWNWWRNKRFPIGPPLPSKPQQLIRFSEFFEGVFAA